MKLYLLPLAYLQPLGVPIVGYLIQTDDGLNILIDSGLPYSYIESPPEPMGPLKLEVEMRPKDHITSRLAELGLKPRDIHYVICTHFDADHAGNHELFTRAEFLVQRRHYEAAKAGHPRLNRVRDHWDSPALRYRLLDGDTALLPEIDLIETSGHVLGHQSVLVRLPKTGPVLLAIDAVPTAEHKDADTREVLSNDEDEAATRASTRKLAEIAEREAVQLVVYGHDAQQWQKLKVIPSYYC
jgi:N-acyl homoserine lactone hydrolase